MIVSRFFERLLFFPVFGEIRSSIPVSMESTGRYQGLFGFRVHSTPLFSVRVLLRLVPLRHFAQEHSAVIVLTLYSSIQNGFCTPTLQLYTKLFNSQIVIFSFPLDITADIGDS